MVPPPNTQAPPRPPGPPLWRVCLWRVCRKRCPQCGVGELLERWWRLAARCPHCGLLYRRESGAATGSMYLATTVNELFGAALFFAVWIFTDWSPTLAICVGVPLVILESYLFLPYSMALWVGVEYFTDVVNREWWAEPRP